MGIAEIKSRLDLTGIYDKSLILGSGFLQSLI